MSDLSTWSSLDDNNNKTPPHGWPEHQAPSTVNNSARAMMGGIRRAYLEQPYFNPGGVISVVDERTFSVADTSEMTNFSKHYTAGRRLRFQSPNGVLYGNVGSVSYAGGKTVVKCCLDDQKEIDMFTDAVLCGLSPEDTRETVGRLPIGMILPYTADKLPPGFLYADGSIFDPSVFTGLAALWKTGENTYRYGQEVVAGVYWPKTPDVRGNFLRFLDMGAGVDTDENREIGSVQEDASRKITGKFGVGFNPGDVEGAFKVLGKYTGAGTSVTENTSIGFDSSLCGPTADENRPKNVAFPALIVAWHGVTPSENIMAQELLDAFNRMSETVQSVENLKPEVLELIQKFKEENSDIDLSAKMATDGRNASENLDFVVDSWRSADGASWYRKYRSGFIEQGGVGYGLSTGYYCNITFPKPFSNTYYFVTGTIAFPGQNVGYANYVGSMNRTTTGTTLMTASHAYANPSATIVWHAFGY